MFNSFQIFACLVLVLIGTNLVGQLASPILKTKASLGQSFLISLISVPCANTPAAHSNTVIIAMFESAFCFRANIQKNLNASLAILILE
jgi:hypothetical protein